MKSTLKIAMSFPFSYKHQSHRNWLVLSVLIGVEFATNNKFQFNMIEMNLNQALIHQHTQVTLERAQNTQEEDQLVMKLL